LILKAKTGELKTVLQQCQTGGYRSDCEEHWSFQCVTTQSGIFEAEDTRRDRKACVEAKQVVVAGHPSDGEITALEGLVSLVI
jgi:hypothetical protein